MAKNFRTLQAQMTDEQRAKSNALYEQMVADMERQIIEPDVLSWLSQQNTTTKHYVNEMIRSVMKMHSPQSL